MDVVAPARARDVAAGLVVASHAGPATVVTVLGGALAAGAGADAGRTVLVAAAVLTGQLSVGWSNDWVDAERDRAVDRRDKPAVTGAVSVRVLRAGALLAAGAAVVLSLATGPAPGLLHVGAVAAAWAYNLRLKSTVWSWLPYAVSFALLPAFCVLAVPGAREAGGPAWWVLVTGALLGVGAHLANVLPDLAQDAATGVRGLPHRLGARVVGVLAPVLLLAGVAVAVAGSAASGWRSAVGLLAGALALAAGGLALARPGRRGPFGLTMAVAVACVVLLVGAGDSLTGG